MSVTHNARVLRRWLITKHTPKQDPAWLEAISSPECQDTDRYLRRTLRDLRTWMPKAYEVLERVYLAEGADGSLSEKWRQKLAAGPPKIKLQPGASERDRKDALAKLLKAREHHGELRLRLHLLEDACRFILVMNAEHDKRVLHWPSPEDFEKVR